MEIYCDGCFNKNTDGHGWSSVVDGKGKDLLCEYRELLSLTLPDLGGEFIEVISPKGKFTVYSSKFPGVVQQNNGAELIALILSLEIALLKVNDESRFPISVYSDSKLIVEYWSLGKVNKKTKANMPLGKIELIELCTKLRKELEFYSPECIKWISGKDNISDIGYHT